MPDNNGAYVGQVCTSYNFLYEGETYGNLMGYLTFALSALGC